MTTFGWMEPPAEIPAEQISKTVEKDIVLIGAGHAGTCAARAAAEAGADIAVLEQQERKKQRILGIGELGYMNSGWQKEHGPDARKRCRETSCIAFAMRPRSMWEL